MARNSFTYHADITCFHNNSFSEEILKIIIFCHLKTLYGRHHDLGYPYNVAVPRITSDVFANACNDKPKHISEIPDIRFIRRYQLPSVQADRHSGRSMLTK